MVHFLCNHYFLKHTMKMLVQRKENYTLQYSYDHTCWQITYHFFPSSCSYDLMHTCLHSIFLNMRFFFVFYFDCGDNPLYTSYGCKMQHTVEMGAKDL